MEDDLTAMALWEQILAWTSSTSMRLLYSLKGRGVFSLKESFTTLGRREGYIIEGDGEETNQVDLVLALVGFEEFEVAILGEERESFALEV